jgi:hypothetical protein
MGELRELKALNAHLQFRIDVLVIDQDTALAERDKANWEATTSRRFATAIKEVYAENQNAILDNPELLEHLAEYAHKSWSGWTKYMFDMWDRRHQSGELFLNRWRRQINTKYADLSEEEKKSDRTEATEILAILTAYMPHSPKA